MSDLDSPQLTIFQEFDKAADAGWDRGEILYRMAGKTSEAEFETRAADGTVSYPNINGTTIFTAIEKLRASMGQPGSGAWLSATIRLSRDGKFSMDADYDNEPAWDVPVVAETYAEEQEMFARDEDHQPEWYRHKLREAGRA